MSTTTPTDEKREERLDALYEMRDELKLAAEADVEYSKYARNGLETLREAGYDV